MLYGAVSRFNMGTVCFWESSEHTIESCVVNDRIEKRETTEDFQSLLQIQQQNQGQR